MNCSRTGPWGAPGASPAPTRQERFVYEGWNLIAAVNGTNAAVIRSFLWGLDLSGSLQGAGGVGGLLAFRQHSGAQAGTHFAVFDGNGNVMALVDGGGALSARYEYDPFGQTIRASGSAAAINPVRFSSKCVDEETDLAYYGYRYLNPNTGKWLARDLIGERHEVVLYGFVKNAPINFLDPDGTITMELLTYSKGSCGSFSVTWSFYLDDPVNWSIDGYFVQKVKMSHCYNSCVQRPGRPPIAEPCREVIDAEYWEAWESGIGGVPAPGDQLYATDTFRVTLPNPIAGKNKATGSLSWRLIEAEMRFFPKSSIGTLEWRRDNGHPSGGLLFTESADAAWFWDGSSSLENVTHSAFISWDCCCAPPESTLVVFPGGISR